MVVKKIKKTQKKSSQHDLIIRVVWEILSTTARDLQYVPTSLVSWSLWNPRVCVLVNWLAVLVGLLGIGKLHAVFCGLILMSWYDIFEMLVSFFEVYILWVLFFCSPFFSLRKGLKGYPIRNHSGACIQVCRCWFKTFLMLNTWEIWHTIQMNRVTNRSLPSFFCIHLTKVFHIFETGEWLQKILN